MPHLVGRLLIAYCVVTVPVSFMVRPLFSRLDETPRALDNLSRDTYLSSQHDDVCLTQRNPSSLDAGHNLVPHGTVNRE